MATDEPEKMKYTRRGAKWTEKVDNPFLGKTFVHWSLTDEYDPYDVDGFPDLFYSNSALDVCEQIFEKYNRHCWINLFKEDEVAFGNKNRVIKNTGDGRIKLYKKQ